KYQADCPHAKSIDVLPFGINPKHHSPIGSQQNGIKPIVPFAGSWFNHKYDERGRWGGDILDAVLASQHYDLLVFDRNSHLRDPRYAFPDRYAHAVTPSISHPQLLDIQRLVDISINLNSVQNSSSMFANRAIELQAQGTYVLSNYNVGLNSRYPHVHISNGFTDTLAALDNLTEPQLRQNQAAGIRSVFSHDLAIMRIAKIIETVGLEATVANPRVQVIKHGHDEQLAHQLAEQTYANVVDVAEAPDVETPAERATHADMVVHVDTAHDYDPTHIEDLVNAFRYTDAQTVEKIPQNAPDQSGSFSHRYAEPANVTSVDAEFVGQIS